MAGYMTGFLGTGQMTMKARLARALAYKPLPYNIYHVNRGAWELDSGPGTVFDPQGNGVYILSPDPVYNRYDSDMERRVMEGGFNCAGEYRLAP